jgi:MFS transporter, putative metabolite:H+ symporter
VRTAALGVGISSAAGGVGKIVGPLVLGLLAGTGNLVAPAATENAVRPGFLFLAACVRAMRRLLPDSHRIPAA